MTNLEFASQSPLMEWAGTQTYSTIDTVLIVPKDGLFYYFSLDDDNWYHLIMASDKNLAEEQNGQ